MRIFNCSEAQAVAFNGFIESVDHIILNLEDVAHEADIKELKKIISNFTLKTNDFFDENRKLNIGVVGQVKAGKSSFLNTLLFNGEEILPKASTPKTATLTKIEYSQDNVIKVEYYAPEEWEVLEENASVDLDDEIYTSAREIINMARYSGITPREYLEKGTEEIRFESYEQLIGSLNNYVGENGKFTPLVKAVTLYVNKEEFKEISIVDTPGLNDPIVSRTIRTKEFMEVCDVVFFLSQSGSFLDKSDWTLLSSQLPQKGVKKLILIASKYDSGIRDVLRPKDEEDDIFGEDESTTDNISKACQMLKKKLKRRAREKVDEFIKDLRRREASEELISVIENCKEPILVSAMVNNMIGKDISQYDSEEMNVYKALELFSKDLESDFALIGDMSQVREAFNEVVIEKEKILSEKVGSFVPTAIEEVKQLLIEASKKVNKRLAILQGNDIEEIKAQKQAMENQMNAIKSALVTTFGELIARLETEKANAIRDLRTASKEYTAVNERTGTVTKTKSYSVSTSKWYNPLSWGSSRTEYYTYEEHYSYMDVADAVDNLRKYTTEAINQVESVFTEAIQIKEMKRRLLNVIIEHFDMGSEKYDSSLFKILVEQTVNRIEFPVVKLDISSSMNQITAKFSGEITSSTEKASLIDALAHAISQVFSEISENLVQEIKVFKEKMDSLQVHIQDALLENINEEFEDILLKYQDKEKEMHKMEDYICKIDVELKKL